MCHVTRECTGARDALGFPHFVKLLGGEDVSLEHGLNLGRAVPQGCLAMAV